MQIDPDGIFADIQLIRKNSPLIHNITNYVVMEQTANALLALGASPVMSHAVEEVEEMTWMANSLVLNIGTLSAHWIQAMRLSLKAANFKGIPVIFDPVGAGATTYRTNTALSLLTEGSVSVIRGNVSEILSLTDGVSFTKGVDSLLNGFDYKQSAKTLAKKNQCTIWMSGKTDVITDGSRSFLVHNGHPFLVQVTGMGCTCTALTAAFLAVNQNQLLGVIHAAATMGITAEIAAKKASGSGSFKQGFIDTLCTISLNDIETHLRVEAL